MLERCLARLLALMIATTLAACGGGGASGAAPTPPVANAGAAQTALAGQTVTLDGSASQGSGSHALTYSWTLASKPAGSATTLANPTSASPTLSPDIAGAYAANLIVTDGTLSSSAATVTVTATAASSLTITTDKSEPLTGTVQLSLSGPVNGAAVAWYVDLASVGSGPTAGWNAAAAVNGSHLVSAQVQVSATQTVEIRRIVNVGNPAVTIGTSIVGSSATVLLNVSAASAAGVASVSASLDGQSLGTLASVNACGQILICSPFVYSLYQFQINGPAIGSGIHTAIVTATDNNGASSQATVTVTISNVPVLDLSTPLDGAFAFGTLRLAGTTSSDKPGPVSVTATLGSTPILQLQDAKFSGSYDLSGVPAGSYTLTVQATDSTQLVTTVTRTVVVTSSAALSYTPAATLGAGVSLLFTDGNQLVYAAGDQSVHLRNISTATDVVLANAANIAYATHWQLGGGQVLVSGRDVGDCTVVNCVYGWRSDGTRSNLTNANPLSPGSAQQWPVVHDGYALWANDVSSYTLYNLSSGAYTLVTPDASASSVPYWKFDFAVAGGIVKVLYSGVTGAGFDDIFRWSSDSASSTRLSAPGQASLAPQTDGTLVAWSAAAAGTTPQTTSLATEPLNGGAITTLSTTMSQFLLQDGVVTWIELPVSAAVLKASTTNGVSTLASTGNPTLVGSSGGFVVYNANGKTDSWDAATGQTSLVVDVAPTNALVAGGKFVFTQGGSGTLYAVPLH